MSGRVVFADSPSPGRAIQNARPGVAGGGSEIEGANVVCSRVSRSSVSRGAG